MYRITHKLIFIVVGLAICFVATTCVAATHSHTIAPPDSFLKYRAATVDDLVEQVQTRASVRRHYAKHFGIPRNKVAACFRDNLHVGSLASDGYYHVHGVDHTGHIYARRQHLKKGSPVFMLADGTPILKGDCGNPMTDKILPARQETTPVAVAPKPPTTELAEAAPSAEIFSAVPGSAAPAAPEEPAVAEMAPTLVASWSAPSASTAGPSPIPSSTPPGLPHGQSPLWLIPVVIGAAGHGGGNTPVIPEPPTVMLLAVGSLPILIATRKKLFHASTPA